MKPFHDSKIWQLNRDYYEDLGIDAWSSGEVPHFITSNSFVGKTYAELIFATLKDLDRKNKREKVFILELGSGHGRLCYHIIKHLDKMIESHATMLPEYCIVLSDIVESNLQFFEDHEQLLPYFKDGKCDLAHYDAMKHEDLYLRFSKKFIHQNGLNQIIIVIANYFFDSIPQDLFHIQNHSIAECLVEIKVKDGKEIEESEVLLSNLELDFEEIPYHKIYDEKFLNIILEFYRLNIKNSHVLFPNSSLRCLEHIRKYSKEGMILISMDKGIHLLSDIENKPLPDFVTHGSFSFQVNFHAFKEYCDYFGGLSFFPDGSNFHIELACLLCVPNANSFIDTIAAYEKNVNEFGPDDYYGMTKFHYDTLEQKSMKDLLYLIRFSAYDSTFFFNILPTFKKVVKKISKKERVRIAQNLHEIWDKYFNIHEPLDLAFELGGIFFDLGYYEESLFYFDHSILKYGFTEDVAYNKALCFFQMNRDTEFLELIEDMKIQFPEFTKIGELKNLLQSTN